MTNRDLRRICIAVLLVAAGALVIWGSLRVSTAERGSTTIPTPSAPQDAGGATLAEARSESGDRTSTAIPSPSATTTTTTKVVNFDASPKRDQGPTLSGTIEFFTSTGSPDGPRDGRLFMEVWADGNRVEPRRGVSVTRGKWSTTVHPDWRLVPIEFHSERGRKATVDATNLDASIDHACALRAQWCTGMRLTVLDRESGYDLPKVSVVFMDRDSESTTPPSGDDRRVDPDRRLKSNSPIALPCFARPMTAWISADGMIPRRIDFGGCTGQRTVSLEHARTVHVVVDDYKANSNLFVIVFREDQPKYERVRASSVPNSGQLDIDGLPVGKLQFSLARSASPAVGELIDLVSVPASGEGSAVHLCAQCDSNSSKFGSIAIAVRNPSNVSLKSVQLTPVAGACADVRVLFRELTDDEDFASRKGLVFPTVAPGTYSLDFRPGLDPTTIVVQAGIQKQIDLDVPTTSRLTVDVFVDKDENPISYATVRVRRIGSTLTVGWNDIAFDPSQGAFTTLLPEGKYELVAGTENISSVRSTVELGSEGARTSIRLLRRLKIPITFQTEETGSNVNFDSELWVKTKVEPTSPAENKHVETSFLATGDEAGRVSPQFVVDGLGEYRFTFPKFPGYRQLSPITVQVSSTSGVVNTIQLTPE